MEKTKKPRLTPVQREILTVIANGQLSTMAEAPLTTIARNVTLLEQRGMLEYDHGTGRFVVTDLGHTALK